MSSSTTRLSKDYPAPSAAGVIKRLLRAALVAEGELEPSPLPIGNDLVKSSAASIAASSTTSLDSGYGGR
jgi:hypothetical protein